MALIIGAIAASGPSSFAAVVDVFLDFPQVAERTASGSYIQAMPVSLSTSIFEVRTANVSRGVQRLLVTESRLSYEVFAPPADFPDISQGYLDLGYASDIPVSLLGGGAVALRIVFEFFSADVPYLFSLYVESAGTRQTAPIRVRGGVDTPTPIDIPFGVFNRVDLGAVDKIGIEAARMPVGTLFRISSITTVPEIATALLLGVGLGWQTLLRRRCPLRYCQAAAPSGRTL